ncbi:MAG: Mini-ribonuclease 3 [Clostridia bacterium]|nr:Mini-ribonuclease 3 [Clostridia bacterium]
MINDIKFFKSLTDRQVVDINPLNLAFIGDAVWTILVREFFCQHTNFKNNNLHKLTTKFVKAVYQAKALDILQEDLTEDEKDISRRARNTKLNTISKNASLVEYKKATSFEAVIGYLYLLGNFDRLNLFFEKLSKDFFVEVKK